MKLNRWRENLELNIQKSTVAHPWRYWAGWVWLFFFVLFRWSVFLWNVRIVFLVPFQKHRGVFSVGIFPSGWSGQIYQKNMFEGWRWYDDFSNQSWFGEALGFCPKKRFHFLLKKGLVTVSFGNQHWVGNFPLWAGCQTADFKGRRHPTNIKSMNHDPHVCQKNMSSLSTVLKKSPKNSLVVGVLNHHQKPVFLSPRLQQPSYPSRHYHRQPPLPLPAALRWASCHRLVPLWQCSRAGLLCRHLFKWGDWKLQRGDLLRNSGVFFVLIIYSTY